MISLVGWSRLTCSEGNVVVRGSAHGRALEVTGVDRNIAFARAGAGGEAVPVAATGVVTTAEELHVLGDYIDSLALGTLLAPLAPLQPAVDRDPATLGQVLGAVLALGAPDGHVEGVGDGLPLLGLGVAAAAITGDAQRADRVAAGQRAQFGITRQVPGDGDSVDVGHVRWLLSSQTLKAR